MNLMQQNGNEKAIALNKEKLISDMKIREEDRHAREIQILKELKIEANQKQLLDNESLRKYLVKFVRKMLLLTVIDYQQSKMTKVQFLLQRYPSYLHLAAIMEERTDFEKETFGKVNFSDLQPSQADMQEPAPLNAFNDEQIEYLTKIYLQDLKSPHELLNQCVQRSSDRYQREHAKMNAFYVQKKFFTAAGLKDRSQTIKYKVMMKEKHPECNDIEKLNNYDKVLGMLTIHNTKVHKIQEKYRLEMQNKAIAKEKGISYKEFLQQQNDTAEPTQKKSKFAKKVKKKDNFDIVIKMKDENGDIQEFDENTAAASDDDSKPSEPVVIEAEATLDMIKKAMGGSATTKPKTVKKKVGTKKKEPVDRIQRFFNNHGENPHLQNIENGYLKYLEAQHAKESHLKALKKFQILHALRKIQRYWRSKYQEIRSRNAKIIQKAVRKFVGKMNQYRVKLGVIRGKLLYTKLKRALLLFIKMRRVKKGYFRPNILTICLAKLKSINKILGLIKIHQAKKALIWRRKCHWIESHKLLQILYLKKYVNKLTREKETYWIQRFSLGKVETDQINKYLKVTEKKFEKNWSQYEDSLEKYLTSKQEGDFKDWIMRKDDTGKAYWTNTTTLKSQVEHPGQKIFQANKKILKNKAQQELQESLKDVQDRKYMIMETIIGLGGKVSVDVSKMRLNSSLQSNKQRAAWRKKANRKNTVVI